MPLAKLVPTPTTLTTVDGERVTRSAKVWLALLATYVGYGIVAVPVADLVSDGFDVDGVLAWSGTLTLIVLCNLGFSRVTRPLYTELKALRTGRRRC